MLGIYVLMVPPLPRHADSIAQDERRGTERRSAVMHARIVMPNQRSFAPCLARDVSKTGAKLMIDKSWLIPPAFWLRFDDDPALRFYTVAWRSATAVGVELAPDFLQYRQGRKWADLLCGRIEDWVGTKLPSGGG